MVSCAASGLRAVINSRRRRVGQIFRLSSLAFPGSRASSQRPRRAKSSRYNIAVVVLTARARCTDGGCLRPGRPVEPRRAHNAKREAIIIFLPIRVHPRERASARPLAKRPPGGEKIGPPHSRYPSAAVMRARAFPICHPRRFYRFLARSALSARISDLSLFVTLSIYAECAHHSWTAA